MAYPLSLPTAAMLAIAGAGLGVHLGRDSVAQINPSFYDDEQPSRFYASLVPDPPSFEVSGIEPPQHPDAIVLDESGNCASCGLAGQAVYVADGAGYERAYAEWSEPEAVRAIPAAQAYAEPRPQLEAAIEQVEIYAGYPVTVAEAEALAEEDLAYAYPE